MRLKYQFVTIALALAGTSSAGGAGFSPPADGKLNDKQVSNYIAISKEQMDALQSAQGAGGASSSANPAMLSHVSEKIDAAIVSRGMTREEYNWVADRVTPLWPLVVNQKQWEQIGKPDLEKQLQFRQEDIAAAGEKQALYERAQKEGKRVISREDQDKAIIAAKADWDSLTAEVKTDEEGIKPISDEIAQHDKAAADAEAAAKNPPAKLGGDEKNTFIDARKNEAQTEHDAAKDARDRLGEGQKSLDDAKARLAAANAKVEHPDVPFTDDEKAQVKAENEQAIADAKTTVSDDEQAVQMLKQTLAAGPMNLPANEKEKSDPDNLALVQKHLPEYLKIISATDTGKTK